MGAEQGSLRPPIHLHLRNRTAPGSPRTPWGELQCRTVSYTPTMVLKRGWLSQGRGRNALAITWLIGVPFR